MTTPENSRALLRHALATVAYRGVKSVSDAPPGFAEFRVAEGSRTPAEILAHIGDLFDWGLSLANGQQRWHDSTPLAWNEQIARFFDAIRQLDERLDSAEPLACPAENLFQGPIADALTHIGQIAMLRRLAGGPVRAENYFTADIASGRVGPEQKRPKAEFG